MKIRIFDSSHEAGIYAATLIENVILHSEKPVLGLATGTTPISTYDALVNLYQCGLDLSGVVTLNLDEYIGLPPTHEQSYHHFMHNHLFSRVNVQEQNIHVPRGQAENVKEECARYDRLIQKYPISLQVLGIGVNGHIGFNEPDDLLMSNTHVVQLREETIRSNSRFFDSTDEVPRQAITMGVQAILQAKQIVLMAFGEEKSKIISQAFLGGVRTDIPASILQLHSDVTVILDRDSAKDLLEASGGSLSPREQGEGFS